MKRTIISLISLVSILGTINCYGGYVMTRKVHNWNGTLGDKWVKSIVNVLLVFVYPFTAIIDFLVLNTLEFWTGSNPLAMKEGEVEVQVVHKDGKEYKITATRNQFEVREVMAGKLGDPAYLTYEPKESAWYMKANGKAMKVSEAVNFNEGHVKLIHPDGKTVDVKL